jgi:hypothetical protein
MAESIEGATMTSAADIWEWIRAPLDELKRDLSAEPDKSWETRRTELLEHLGLSDPSQYPLIEPLFQHLDEMTEEDRTNEINSGQIDSVAYELAQQYTVSQDAGQAQAAPAAAPTYDEQAWQAYLTENGPAWDGTAENWDQFTQWFRYYADERGLGDPATALIDYLTAQSAAERITTLAQYGVTINPAAAQAGQLETSQTSDQDADSIMADILEANPDLAGIPEERRREIMAEVFGQDQS